MPSKRLRMAVVGLRQGSSHAGAIAGRRDCELVAVCDRDEQVLQHKGQSLGLAAAGLYTDYQQMIETAGLDGVVIATPVQAHASMAIAALERGLHVLLEKPMTLDLPSAYELQRAADRSGRVVQIGFEFRSSPLIRKASQIIESGELGRVVLVWSNMFRQPSVTAADGWRGQVGLFFDCMIHEIDGLLHFAGADFERVAAFGAPPQIKGPKPTDVAPRTVTACIEFENAVRGSLAFSDLVRNYDHTRFGIVGDRGRIDGQMMDGGSLKVYTDGGLYRTTIDIDGSKTCSGHLGFHEQYDFFVASVRDGAPNVSDMDNAVRVQRIMAAFESSMCEDRSVYRKEVESLAQPALCTVA